MTPTSSLRLGCDEPARGVRDRALILTGFSGAFRRSELAALETNDLTFQTEGLVIDLRRSKTDQETQGREVGIPRGADEATGPVRALERWLTYLERWLTYIDGGPVFRAIGKTGRILA